MATYADNKKALFDYEILETFEAGLILSGQEVKSVRKGGASLKGSFVTFHASTPLLTNAHISKYKFAGNVPGYDPVQSRKILLNEKEINYLRGKLQERGLTIIPLSLYNKGRLVKLKIGLAKGKKQFDKRETIKKRELNKEISRSLKNSS